MNNDSNSEYWNAIRDIDSLTEEGFFGHEVKELYQKRGKIDKSDYLVKSLEIWISDTHQYGKNEVKKIILIFLELINDSIETGGQKSIDTITSFFKGYKGHPQSEATSSYIEFIRSNIETRKMIIKHSMKKLKISERKRIADSIVHTYSKGVELINKMLTTWILLIQLSNNKVIEPMAIYSKFLGKKLKLYLKESNGKYDSIVESIDRNIRNADSHIDIRYDTDGDVFEIKIQDINNKLIHISKIPANKMILEVIPKVGWVIQGFIYACTLTTLCGIAPDKYQSMIKKIYNL